MQFFKDAKILIAATFMMSAPFIPSTAHAGALFDELPRCDVSVRSDWR